MSGSSLAPIIIPVVVVPVLAFWLIIVAYADRHPAWRGRGQAAARPAPGQLSGQQARALTPAPRGPGDASTPAGREHAGASPRP